MADETNHDQHLEKLMNHLADSVLVLSDEAILAEVSETGANPEEEAERTRLVLGGASQALENLNKRLSNLGHMINSDYWRRGHGEYHNNCLNCGSLVSFAIRTGEIQGKAVHEACPESGQRAISRREVSRK